MTDLNRKNPVLTAEENALIDAAIAEMEAMGGDEDIDPRPINVILTEIADQIESEIRPAIVADMEEDDGYEARLHRVSNIEYRPSRDVTPKIYCRLSTGYEVAGDLTEDGEPYNFEYTGSGKHCGDRIGWNWERAIIKQVKAWMGENPIPDYASLPLKIDSPQIGQSMSIVNRGQRGFIIAFLVCENERAIELLKDDLSGLCDEKASLTALERYRGERNPSNRGKYEIARAREIRQWLSNWFEANPIPESKREKMIADANQEIADLIENSTLLEGDPTYLEVRLPQGGTTILKMGYPADFPLGGHTEMGWDAFSRSVAAATRVGLNAQQIADFPFRCMIEEYADCFVNKGVREHHSRFKTAWSLFRANGKSQGNEANGDKPLSFTYGRVLMKNWVDTAMDNSSEDHRVGLQSYLEPELTGEDSRTEQFLAGWEAYKSFVHDFTNAYCEIRYILMADVGHPDLDPEFLRGVLACRDAYHRAYFAKRRESELNKREARKEDKAGRIFEATVGWAIKHRKKVARRKQIDANGVDLHSVHGGKVIFDGFWNGHEYGGRLILDSKGHMRKFRFRHYNRVPADVPNDVLHGWVRTVKAKLAARAAQAAQ